MWFLESCFCVCVFYLRDDDIWSKSDFFFGLGTVVIIVVVNTFRLEYTFPPLIRLSIAGPTNTLSHVHRSHTYFFHRSDYLEVRNSIRKSATECKLFLSVSRAYSCCSRQRISILPSLPESARFSYWDFEFKNRSVSLLLL